MNLTELFTSIAEAIRNKKETTEKIKASDFPNEILSIEGGVDTSDATATADNLEEGKTAYVNGEKITGTLILDNAKMYKSLDEMYADTTVVQGDYGVVETEFTKIRKGIVFNKLLFPEYVVLDSNFTAFCVFGNSEEPGKDIYIAISAGDWGSVTINITENGQATTINYSGAIWSGNPPYTFTRTEDISSYTFSSDTSITWSNGSEDDKLKLQQFALIEGAEFIDCYLFDGTNWNPQMLDTSDADATAEDIASGKTAYVNGEKITGTASAGGGLDTSQFRNCSYLYDDNDELVNAPYFDTSNVTNMEKMHHSNSNLISVPHYNTSNVTNFYRTFYGCQKLVEIPHFDTSKATKLEDMLNSCWELTNSPQFDFTNATSILGLYLACKKITEVKDMNTNKVTNMQTLFKDCISLENVGVIQAEKVTKIYNAFSNCPKLTNMGGLINLGQAYTQKSNNYMYYALNLSQCPLLTHDSLMNVINNLYDLNISYDVANGGTLYTQQLVLGETNLAKLTEEEIAIATNKGWTVS